MSAEGWRFSASYDRTTKSVSAAAVAILLFAPLATRVAVVGVVSAAIGVLSFVFSPRGYVVSSGELIVRRWIGDVHIPLTDLRVIRRASPSDLAGCIRLFGSGGLFGYYGLFRTTALGKSTWYTTSQANRAVMISDSGTRVFSPDDVDGFLRAIEPMAREGSGEIKSGRAQPAATENGPVPPNSRWRFFVTRGTVLLGVLGAGIALKYSPGTPEIEPRRQLDHT